MRTTPGDTPHSTVLYRSVVWCSVLHCSVLQWSGVEYSVVWCIVMHCTTPYVRKDFEAFDKTSLQQYLVVFKISETDTVVRLTT